MDFIDTLIWGGGIALFAALALWAQRMGHQEQIQAMERRHAMQLRTIKQRREAQLRGLN